MQGLQSLQEAWLLGAVSAGLPCEENRWCQGQESFAAAEPRVNAELPDRGQDAMPQIGTCSNLKDMQRVFPMVGQSRGSHRTQKL